MTDFSFTTERAELQRIAEMACIALNPKAPSAVLQNLKLSWSPDDGISIMCSGGDRTIICRASALGTSQSGSILLPAQKFCDILRKGDGESADFECKGGSAKLKIGRSRFTLNCLDSSEYPNVSIPEVNPGWMTVPTASLARLVARVAYSASSKEQRPILTAIHIDVSDGNMKACATDSARAALASEAVDAGIPPCQANIGARMLLESIRLFEGDKEVQVLFGENNVAIKSPSAACVMRLVAGQYPDISRVVPQNYAIEAVFPKNALVGACSRASIVNPDSVLLMLKPDGAMLSASSQGSGECSETIECSVEGVDSGFETAFNPQFLCEAIKACGAEDEVTIRFVGQMKPFAVDGGDSSTVHIMTPIRV